jgi:hypothetical protein
MLKGNKRTIALVSHVDVELSIVNVLVCCRAVVHASRCVKVITAALGLACQRDSGTWLPYCPGINSLQSPLIDSNLYIPPITFIDILYLIYSFNFLYEMGAGVM